MCATVARSPGADGSEADLRDRSVGGHSRWQAIEVRHLVALAVVAEEGSFRRAADRLEYVQSAISGQISHLEQAIGLRLLERASGTPVVELTQAGRVLLRHTEEILARFDSAYADVSSLSSRSTGAVRVAGLERLAPEQVARLMSAFRHRYPFSRVILSDDAGPEARIVAGGVDVLIREQSPLEPPLAEQVFAVDPYVLVLPAGSPLAGRSGTITAAELVALQPIVPGRCITSPSLAGRLQELGVRTCSAVAPESAGTAQAIVAAGLSAALVPSRLLEPKHRDLPALDLSHLVPPRTLVAVYDGEREQTAAVRGFLQQLKAIDPPQAPADADPAMQAA